MGGSRVEVIIQFFHIFPMVPLVDVQPEKPFLQDRILPIPKAEGKTKMLALVGKSPDTFFTSAPGLAVRDVMCGKGPGLPIRAVVFPYSTPRTL